MTHGWRGARAAVAMRGGQAIVDGREPATEALWCALCPEAALGAVVGDVARRGGQVLGLDVRDADDRVIHAEVPLARVFGYAGALSG